MRIVFAILFCLCLLPATALADFNQGKLAYDMKQWRQAITNLRPAAERGDARAMVLLGNMYAHGYGVEKDEEEAFILFRRAAHQDNLDGILATAAFYQEGRGVSKNTRLAIEWFGRGAEMGSQSCAFFYAVHTYQGSKGKTYDFKPDAAESYKWFVIASRSAGMPAMAKTAENMAKQIGDKMNPLERAAAQRRADDWRPKSASTLGPAPDLELLQKPDATEGAEGAMPPEEQPEVRPETTPEEASPENAQPEEPAPAEKHAE